MTIQEIIQNKIFCSLITGIFFVAIDRLYLYIQELRMKYEFSDKLRDVVNNYIKNGKITMREYVALTRVLSQNNNYKGIYRESVERMMKDFGEHGDLNYGEGVFDEKEDSNINEKNDLDTLLQEKLRLMQENSNLKKQNSNNKNELTINKNEDVF